MTASTPRILVCIFHKPGANERNYENLRQVFNGFDIYVPTIDYFGNKWNDAKKYFSENGYDSLFVICSDVSIVCGNISDVLKTFCIDKGVGMYGFGTINNYTFNWLRYDNINLLKDVPFIEGYCFGINKALLPHLQLTNTFGYGLDVEMGYQSHANGLKVVLSSEVCISHEFGKSYDDTAATEEYISFLVSNPQVHSFLKSLNIYTPV